MFTFSNFHLHLSLGDDFSGTLDDPRTGARWRFQGHGVQERRELAAETVWNRQERNFMDSYACAYRLEQIDGRSAKVRILDRLGNDRGGFRMNLALENEWLVMEAVDIEESLPSLIFPPFIASAGIVIPREIGMWYRKAECDMTARYHMPVSGWNMRWIGGLGDDNDAGWLMVVDDGFEDSGCYRINLNASIGWQKTLGRWSPHRRVKIALTQGGYVGLAKKFREYARDHGLLTTLDEKIARNPEVEHLIGGRCLNFFQAHTINGDNHRILMNPPSPEQDARDGEVVVNLTHAEVKQVAKEACEAGMKKGYLNLRGWINGGYDQSHPDVWPPEPALGGVEEFREIINAPGPVIPLFHDNYQDIYAGCPSFPEGVARGPDGHYYEGGLWHGGQCYIVNSTAANDYARRNWEIYRRELNMRGIFLDTLAGAHFHQDFDPGHPQTRAEDAAAKLRIGEFFRQQGLVIGSEEGSDFSVPVADFIENRHRRVQGETIPLWPLVYHDCVVNLRYASGTSDERPASDLEDMLWGYAKLWPVPSVESWRAGREDFRQSLFIDRWHAEIARMEMIDHRFLDADETVEKTVFLNGKSVVANFGDTPWTEGGRSIEPGGCLIGRADSP